MTNDPRFEDVAVDRREETVVTAQPGYTTTEQSTRDVAAEQRMTTYQITRLIWTLLAVLEIVLSLRFLLKLIGANAASGFGSFVYGITAIFVKPFAGLISTWTAGDSILEVNTLVAMAIYALLFWGFVRILSMVMERTGSHTVTRSTREQTSGGPGNERTTHTTSNT
jgi:uncharacterized membrane protein